MRMELEQAGSQVAEEQRGASRREKEGSYCAQIAARQVTLEVDWARVQVAAS